MLKNNRTPHADRANSAPTSNPILGVLSAFTVTAVAATLMMAVLPNFAQAENNCASPFDVETVRAEFRASSARERIANATVAPLQLEAGRNIYLQVVKPETPETPFYLFLPGSNRSLFLNEGEMQSFVARGYGMGAMNFSTQPHSISSLKKNERPAFYSKDMKLADFAKEVEMTIAKLQAQGIKNIIPVSLSYSGVLSPMLAPHDVIVETAPMTSMGAAQPELEKALELQRYANLWNPIFGPGITRAYMDNVYRDTWKAQVDRITSDFDLPTERRQDFIEGYTAMSRAAESAKWEDFDLTKTKPASEDRWAPSKAMPSAGSRRAFIVAGGESKTMLKHQLQTYLKLAGVDSRTSLFMIEQSGHVIPVDQPALYQWSLAQLTTMETSGGPFYFVLSGDGIRSSSGRPQVSLLKGAEAIKAVQKLAESLP